MGLTDDESKLLAKLLKKKDTPDAPPGRTDRVLNVSVDLADEKQVERARGLGLIDWITGGDDGGDDGGDGGDDDGGNGGDGGDDPPRRKGFFREA